MYFEGKQFLIFIDVYSRWLDVKIMNDLTADTLIEKLEDIFAYFGYPKNLVSDNGPPYTSYAFKKYCEENNIKLIHTPPYHPASNGMVERGVQTVKQILKKLVLDAKRLRQQFDIRRKLRELLKNQRNLPTTSDNIVPSHRLLSYKPRWEMDALREERATVINKQVQALREGRAKEINKQDRILKPSIKNKEKSTNSQIKTNRKKNVRFEIKQNHLESDKGIRSFKKGEEVWYLHRHNGDLYRIKATVAKRLGSVRYLIIVNDRERVAHVNQMEKKPVRKKYFFNDLLPTHESSSNTGFSDTREKVKLEQEGHSRPITDKRKRSHSMDSAFRYNLRSRLYSEPDLDGRIKLRRTERVRKPTQFYTPG